MLKISKFVGRSIGVWFIVVGLGSFLLASRYSDMQARAFRETLQSRHPEMDVREVLALTDTFGSANETIIWIMACTSIVWFCMTGVLAYALEKKSKTQGEQGGAPNSRPPSQLPSSPEVRSPDSLRASSPGGCG